MHYKNGRLAKNGDRVVGLVIGNLVAGILHSTTAGSTTCNGRVAVTTPNDPYVTISDLLHIDDIAAAVIPPPAAA